METVSEDVRKKRMPRKRQSNAAQLTLPQAIPEAEVKIEEKPNEAPREFKLHSELVDYVGSLEYQVLSSRAQLRRERAAYAQIFQSISLFFGTSGVSSQQVEEYVDKFVNNLKEPQEEIYDQDYQDLDWIGFLQGRQNARISQKGTTPVGTKAVGSSSAIPHSTSDIPSTNSNNNISVISLPQPSSSSSQQQATQVAGSNNLQSNPSTGNVIRLQINGINDKNIKSAQQQTNTKVAATESSLSKKSNISNNDIPTNTLNNSNSQEAYLQEEPKPKKKRNLTNNNAAIFTNNSRKAISTQFSTPMTAIEINQPPQQNISINPENVYAQMDQQILQQQQQLQQQQLQQLFQTQQKNNSYQGSGISNNNNNPMINDASIQQLLYASLLNHQNQK